MPRLVTARPQRAFGSSEPLNLVRCAESHKTWEVLPTKVCNAAWGVSETAQCFATGKPVGTRFAQQTWPNPMRLREKLLVHSSSTLEGGLAKQLSWQGKLIRNRASAHAVGTCRRYRIGTTHGPRSEFSTPTQPVLMSRCHRSRFLQPLPWIRKREPPLRVLWDACAPLLLLPSVFWLPTPTTCNANSWSARSAGAPNST